MFTEESEISFLYFNGRFGAYDVSGKERPESSTNVGFEPFLFKSWTIKLPDFSVLRETFIGIFPDDALIEFPPTGETFASVFPAVS